MKSMIFWATLALAATVSASWMQKDQIDPSGGNQVVAQQAVVQPQFPAQALGRSAMPSMPPQPEEMARPSGPPMVMPRAVPGVPGPPPQAQSALPSNTSPPQIGMMQRRGVPPPMVTRAQQPQAPAPVQTAIPFSR